MSILSPRKEDISNIKFRKHWQNRKQEMITVTVMTIKTISWNTSSLFYYWTKNNQNQNTLPLQCEYHWPTDAGFSHHHNKDTWYTEISSGSVGAARLKAKSNSVPRRTKEKLYQSWNTPWQVTGHQSNGQNNLYLLCGYRPNKMAHKYFYKINYKETCVTF